MTSEKRAFVGMNSDASPFIIPSGDYLAAYNLHIGSSDVQDTGVATSVLGNSPVATVMPDGVNICIGAFEDKPTSTVYFFNYNSNGNHFIARFSKYFTTQIILKSSVLNFDRSSKITSAVLYNKNLLYFTDNLNAIRKINIDTAIAGGYGIVSEQKISLIKYAPLTFPTCVTFNNSNVKTNYIKRKAFQFRYSWTYDDNEESAMSPISDLQAYDQNENSINIILNTGYNLIKYINVYGRIGNTGDWFLIEQVNKAKLGIASNSTYAYLFLNDKPYSLTDQRKAIKTFDRVPRLAKTLDIVDGDRLVVGNILEGYNNVSVDFKVNVNYVEQPSSISLESDFNFAKSLKTFTTYQFGIVYFDAAGRHGAVNIDKKAKIKLTYNTAGIFFYPTFNYEINSMPPDWAKKYAIVRNRYEYDYLQFLIDTVKYANDDLAIVDKSIATKILVGVGNILTYAIEKDSIKVYDFSEGDRVRFLSAGAEREVLSYDTKANAIVVNLTENDGMINEFFAGDAIEIYSPSITVSNDIYYEIHTEGDILDNGYHGAGIGGVAQTASNPATGNITTYDTYIRKRTVKVAGVDKSFICEDNSISDFYISKYSDIGRPNIVSEDEKEIRRETTIYFSEIFVPDTKINGLSSFYETNFERYSDYGAIQKVLYLNKRLLVFQVSKVGSIPINERVIYDSVGSSLIPNSDKVLNSIVYYQGEFGVSYNPESVCVFGSYVYFTDILRGAVLRLGLDGLTPISENHMHNFFKIKGNIINGSGLAVNVKIYGAFNRDFNEYTLSIVDENSRSSIGTDVNTTIGFNETTNRFTSFYDFKPEYTCSLLTGIASFKNGIPYIHNKGLYANFYGVQYDCKLSIVFNQMLGKNKTYLMMGVDSTSEFDVDVTTSNNQNSVLKQFDFENIKGDYYASFLRDINTPYEANPLLDGEVLNGEWIQLDMSATPTEQIKLLTCEVGFANSDFVSKN